jgi:hypothetical protein
MRNRRRGPTNWATADGSTCVKPSKTKLWRMAYRYGGREKLLALGAYPEVSLKDAREKRDAAKANYGKASIRARRKSWSG